MIKIGAHVSSSGGLDKIFERAGALGVDTVQIFSGSPRGWAPVNYTDELSQSFRDRCKSESLEVFIHTLYLINLATTNSELFEKSSNSLAHLVKNGDKIGATAVITHLGSHFGAGFDSIKKQVADALIEAADQAENTVLAIENSSGRSGSIGRSMEELISLYQLVRKHPKIGFCLDTAHFFSSGYDIRDPKLVDQYLDMFDREIGLGRLVALHLNDSKVELANGNDRHENIGEGHIGLEAFRYLVNHPELKDKPALLEVPGFDGKGPDKANVDIVKSLANN